MTNEALVENIKVSLGDFGYGDSSLVATSLCCDEVNRTLERDLAGLYGHYFAMGGLAGIPFGGVTAFGAMAAHIPDGGSCLIVYGPHVGVDVQGNVGTVDRRGRVDGGTCCGSAVAAAEYVKGVVRGGNKPACAPTDAFDAQQFFVGNLILPHGERIHRASEPMAELPYVLFDVQTELIQKIVAKGCGNVPDDGKIALLGGIQINTPPGMSDYFLPLRFDIMDNRGEIVEKILQGPPRVCLSKSIIVVYKLVRHSVLTFHLLCSQAAITTIKKSFPKALRNVDLVKKVSAQLAPYGYGKSTLLCTSLCCDEVNRPLEKDFQKAFGDHFHIGGLAGFAFGGATGFGAMVAHIPDDGSCLVVYGPHVGVDSAGRIGTVDRRGRVNGGICCGSGAAAAAYVKGVMNGEPRSASPTDLLDAQQVFVGNMLLPYGEWLAEANDPNYELPFALFQAQDKLMKRIVIKKGGDVSDRCKIALLGGIQINTPEGASDYFLPLRFEVLSKQGRVVTDLMDQWSIDFVK